MEKKRKRKYKRRVKKSQKLSKVFYLIPLLLIVLAIGIFVRSIYSPYVGTTDVAYPYDPNRPLHPYDLSKLENKNGIYTYEDDRYTTRLGIDVSYHNGSIDWQKVKDAGVSFVMIRAGYRGYSEGQLHEDEKFKEYIKGAREVGLDIGIYFYSQAISEEEAAEEAAFTINLVRDYDITMPIVYDYEFMEELDARGNKISILQRTRNAVVYAENIKQAGFTPMIYASTDTYDTLYDYTYLTSYDTWIAQYHTTNTYPYAFAMWQYTDQGLQGTVLEGMDLDIEFIQK